MMATLEAKSGKTSVRASLTHSSKDGLLDGVVGTSECNIRKTTGRNRIESIACTIREITINVATCVEATIDDVGIKAFVAVHVLHKSIIVVSEGQSFRAAKVEQDVAIDINDVTALRLEVVDQRVHLRCLLEGTDVVAS